MTGQSTPPSITPAAPGEPPVAARGAAPAARGARARPRLVEHGRPLKRWRYVGIFSDELMACAALVQVGPARQSFWALRTRGEEHLRERTRTLWRRGAVRLSAGRLLVSDGGVRLELALDEQDGIEARCAHGRGTVWTRKQAGVRARGTLSLDGGPACAIDALAVIDDTAGYHARVTEWWWSAGVGSGPDGIPLAWNLVRGVNDPASGSERAVWVAGVPHEAPAVEFSADLARIRCEDGAELHFAAQSERARSENLLLLKSDYRAPFGTFSGMLPGAVALARGLGVVEHHRAVW